jgi:excisionase family DNA binding protein
MDAQAPTLLTASEAADVVRLTTRQVVRLANRGELPSVRLPGDELRFDAADLWRWIDTHRQPAPADLDVDVVVDPDAAAGDVLVPLARLLIDLARKRLASGARAAADVSKKQQEQER